MSSKRLHLEGMKNSQTSNNPLRQWAKISKRPFTKEMVKKHMKRCAKPFAMGSGAGKATRTSLRAYLNGPRLTKYMEKAPHVTKGTDRCYTVDGATKWFHPPGKQLGSLRNM